jgi:hypothetical protein
MIKNAAIVLMIVIAKMSRYDCLCVKPVIASNVITAPLCGSVSIPPEAIEITRCITSSGIPNCVANSIYLSAIIPREMAIPAEAEPEIAERTFVVTAPFNNGFVNNLAIPSLATVNPGRF